MANFSKIFGLAGTAVVFAGMAFGQQATCGAPTTTTNIIRAEGTAELVSAVTFVCTSAAGQPVGQGINAQVFLSPALPITSRVVVSGTSQTEATLTITSSAGGGTSTILGTVSGSTINFSGYAPIAAALPAGGTLTFVISNVRVNATSLSVGAGVPPSISETIFVSGPSVVPTALASATVAFAQNGLAPVKIFKTFTGTLLSGTGTTAGGNNFVICNPYSPKADAYAPGVGVVAGKSLASVVEVNENFAQAFKTATDESTGQGSAFTPYTSGGTVPVVGAGGVAGTPLTLTASNTTISTRFKLNFTNVPSNVTLVVPVGAIQSQVGGAFATWVTSDTGTTASTTDSLAGENSLGLRAVAITSGAGSVTFSITTDDLTNLDKFDIPVFVITASNSVPGSSTPFSVSASLAPVGSTSVPNFVVGASTATTTLSTFNLCTTSLLFPFVTNQLGFDTGIAISNTSTDPFGANGATAQSGTCTLNFYGAGAPSPSAVVLPTAASGNNIGSGTTAALVVSSVAPGFQGYVIAQCAFQYAHAFAFVTNGVGTSGGLSQGYLAGVIPDVNQVTRGANPTSQAPAGSGETLAN